MAGGSAKATRGNTNAIGRSGNQAAGSAEETMITSLMTLATIAGIMFLAGVVGLIILLVAEMESKR